MCTFDNQASRLGTLVKVSLDSTPTLQSVLNIKCLSSFYRSVGKRGALNNEPVCVSLEKDVSVEGDDVFKGPVDPAVTSAAPGWECPEDVMSTLERS